MKKAIIWILMIAMVLSSKTVFAESSLEENSENDYLEILTSDIWVSNKDSNSRSTHQFFMDGSGDNEGYAFTWQFKDGEFEVTFPQVNRTVYYTFGTDENNNTILVRKNDSQALIRYSDIKSGENAVYVLLDDGTVEETSGKEILDKYVDNEFINGDKYRGATAIVISKIEDMKGPLNYNGLLLKKGFLVLSGPWYIEIPYNSVDFVKTLNKGDIVVATVMISMLQKYMFHYQESEDKKGGLIIGTEQFNPSVKNIVPLELYDENADQVRAIVESFGYRMPNSVQAEEDASETADVNTPIDYSDKQIVKAVQQALNDAGFNCGTPDGVAGKKTTAAIKDYQAANGLSQTGEIDDVLLASLGLS